MGVFEPNFKAFRQVKYSINLFREATFTLKQISHLWVHDHMSSYVNTLKTTAYFDMENNLKILALNVINILNLFLIFVVV